MKYNHAWRPPTQPGEPSPSAMVAAMRGPLPVREVAAAIVAARARTSHPAKGKRPVEHLAEDIRGARARLANRGRVDNRRHVPLMEVLQGQQAALMGLSRPEEGVVAEEGGLISREVEWTVNAGYAHAKN